MEESDDRKNTHQNVRRGRYFRGSRRGTRGGNSDRYQNKNLTETDENRYERVVYENGSEGVSSSIPHHAHSVERVPKFKNNRILQTNLTKSSSHAYNNSERARNFRKPQRDTFAESESFDLQDAHSVRKTDPLRGNIVGGRYIRKHSNFPITHSSSSDPEFPAQNIVSEENLNECYFNDRCRDDFPYQENEPHLGNSRRHFSSGNMNHISSDQNSLANSGKMPQFYQKNYRKYNNNRSFEGSHNFNASNGITQRKFGFEKRSGADKSSSFEKKCDINKNSQMLARQKEDNATQRELLILRLNKGECECLVCCELIRVKDQIWHCLSCYHVLHLRCIRKWARSPAAAVEGEECNFREWRCPACQNLESTIPFDYFCFCGKSKNPEVNYHLTPHSCGEICGRKRLDCDHLCKELCHPGPCPPCLIVVSKTCACGKTSKTVPCSHSMQETCNFPCEKLLNCGVHKCECKCHTGNCSPCEETIAQTCFCGRSERNVACTAENVNCLNFSCGNVCKKDLNCGHHTCNLICHHGICNPCQLSNEVVKTCHCGKSTISELVSIGEAKERVSCLDPIPVCKEICEKILYCGPKDNPHTCPSLCHEGDCPRCPLSTSMKCRCGAFTKEFLCAEITPSFVFLCEKRCNRRKDCGRHKCLNNCCTNIEHKCELVCNRKLSCGLHHCQETCHMGNCPTCWNVSFDELRCHCGSSVLYPPIHCGTKPPECSKPCLRNHSCEHEVKHSCHSEESCPPCTSLTVKWCYGKHKQCGTVMCFLDGISCGMPCSKPLPCGKHKCLLTCHPGPCLKDDAKCTQLCSVQRPSCGHPCGNHCHDGPCPETPCKSQVTLNCPCGHRSETGTCYDSTKSYHLLSVTVLASKMQEIKEGQSVNLSDVLGKKSKNNRLQCNEECAVLERNKRLAVALQIQNPDLSCSPGPPTYSEFLKDEAKKSPHFVSEVYDKITDLVQLAKQSKQKCRSHSFPPMNRDQRRVVHELAEFFGCETQSYDEEPKKNVVVTAYKSKCWLPFASIMSVVQRDMGIRKGPAPLLAQRDSKASSSSSVPPVTNQKKKIDYFDYNE